MTRPFLRTPVVLCLLAALASAGDEMRREPVAARITAIEGEVATVDLGAEDGLAPGMRGDVLAAHARGLDDPVVGTGEVAAVEARTARVRLAPAQGREIRAGDFVELEANTPVRARSPLWELARRRVAVRYADGTAPPIEYRRLYRDESPVLVETLYDAMATRLRAYAAAKPDERAALAETRPADVASFVRWLAEFEWALTGRTVDLERVFAAWVKQGRTPGLGELTERLVAAADDETRAALFRAHADRAKGADVVADLRRRATDLADAADFAGARAHLAAAAVGAEILDLARAKPWVLFARAYVLGAEDRGDEELAAYAAALAAFRALDPPDRQGEALCHNNMAAEYERQERRAEALAAYVAAEQASRAADAGDLGAAAKKVGDAYLALGRKQEAADAYARAAVQFRDEPGRRRAILVKRADLLLELERFEEALPVYRETLRLARAAEHPREEGQLLERIAWVHLRARRFEESLARYEDALAIHRQQGFQRGIAFVLDKIARVHYDAGDWKRSHEAHRVALAARRESGLKSCVAPSLRAVAELDLVFGDLDEALQLYEEAVAIHRAEGDADAVALVLLDVGHTRNLRYEFEEALKAYDESVAHYRTTKDRAGLAFALRNRGVAHQNRRDFDAALQDYREALALRRALDAPRDVADSLDTVARALWDKGDLAKAGQVIDEALAAARGMKDRALEAQCLRTEAHVLAEQGKALEGTHRLTAAREIYAELHDTLGELRVWHEDGRLHERAGFFEYAADSQRMVHEAARRFQARPLAVQALTAHAAALRMLGRLAEAGQRIEEAAQLVAEIRDDGLKADVLVERAEIASALGENARALAACDEALAIRERIRDARGRARVLALRGRELERQGERDRALEDYLAAMTFGVEANDWPLLAELCPNQGELLLAHGKIDTALQSARVGVTAGTKTIQVGLVVRSLILRMRTRGVIGGRLLREGKEQEGRRMLELAEADHDLSRELALGMEAKLLLAEIDLEASEILLTGNAEPRPWLERALQCARGSEARHLLWRIHFDLSVLDEKRGELARAIVHRRESVRVLEEIRSALGGGPAARQRFVEDRIGVYESLVELLGKLIEREPDAAKRQALIDEAMELVARARFERMGSDVGGTGSPRLDELLAKYRQAERDHARQREAQVEALAGGNAERARSLGVILARTEERLGELFTDLKAQDADLGARLRFDPRRIGEAMLDAPEGATLVVYFPGETKLFLWVFTHAGFAEWRQVPIGRAALYALVKDYRDRIAEVVERVGHREPMGKGFGPEAEADDANPAWYRANAKATRAVLGKLHGVLLAPIADHVGKADPLLILPYGQLSYLPFEALLDPDGKFVGATKRLAYFTSEHHLADALRGLRDAPRRGDDVWVAFADPRGRLASSLEEAAEIGALFGTAEVHTQATGTAGEEHVLGLRADCTILHFATHGFLNGDRPSRTYLEMDPKSGDGQLAQGEIWPRLKRQALPFREHHVRLVVLSACETARGATDPQAEVLGMPDAFVMAGAPTVVASLWSVYTYTTTDLMIEFYRRHVTDKQDPASALRDARRTLLDARNGRYAHPFYWAPFLLFGDWR